MKKKTFVCILFIILVFSVFGADKKNSYGYMYENKFFASVMDAINLNKPYEEVKKIYSEAVNGVASDIATLIRLKTAYLEYVNNIGNKNNKNELKQILDSCYTDLEKLEKSNTISALKDSLTFLVYGVDYRITGSISKGTKSIKLIDDCFTKNSEDEGIMLIYAQRKAEAPKIGGGDVNVALNILNKLLENIDNQTKAFQYAVYYELGYVYKNSNAEKSTFFYNKAASLY